VLAIDLELQADLDQPRAANEAQRMLVMDAPCDLAISASCRTQSKACAWLAWIRPNAYDRTPAGRRALARRAPGGAALAELPAGAGKEASESQRGTLRRLGIETVRHRVVQVAASWC
jgi:hypothetical protein